MVHLIRLLDKFAQLRRVQTNIAANLGLTPRARIEIADSKQNFEALVRRVNELPTDEAEPAEPNGDRT